MRPVASSTSGYWMEMGVAHFRQRPLSTIQESTGMLSYQAISSWHLGHRERGVTTDSSLGHRSVQTFRNDPKRRPKSPAPTGTYHSATSVLPLRLVSVAMTASAHARAAGR
ncbi:MAG: hypothetical protein ABL963_15720 [Longimicrobiales bacterium]